MIPKLIHYCWLSDDPVSGRLQRCMRTWREVLPDYEFVLWDRKRFDLDTVPWVREAYDAGKYAFAADYIRFYAVYTMGGIYLDMDVEVVRPFDELLNRPYLLGAEYADYPEAGVFGAEPHSELMKLCMDFYLGRHFSPDQQTLTTCKAPQVMHDALVARYAIRVTDQLPTEATCIALLPKDYLTAMNADTGIAHPTVNTRTIHHFAGSWCYTDTTSKLRRASKILLSRVLGERLVRRLRSLFLPNYGK